MRADMPLGNRREMVGPAGSTISHPTAYRRTALRWVTGYLFMSPALAIFGLFFLLPVFYAVLLSFQSWNGLSPIESATWVGLDNYLALFNDDIFGASVVNTAIITFWNTTARTGLAFLLAFGLWYYGSRFSAFQRLTIFAPTVLAMVLVGLLWQQTLARTGPVNSILGMEVAWFGDPDLVLIPVVWMGVWQWTGWSMMIYLAAMVSVPKEVIEAARMDGAGDARIGRSIVWPMVGHATTLVVLLNIIGSAQTFDTIHVTTRGGPDHGSETMTTFAYWAALDGSGPGAFGLASAASCLIIAALMVVAVIRLRMIRDVQ